MRTHRPLLLLLSLTLSAPLAAQQHAHAPAAGEQVGSVHFETTCDAAVQPAFERAVAMLHSFWFEAALDEFTRVAEQDPGCALAHWGAAMTLWGNPMARSNPSPARTAAALEAIARAESLFAETSPRERAWVEAAAVLYRDHDRLDHLQRMRLHEDAMRELAGAYPDDVEARIFLGRIMVANAPPDDLTFERQRMAAEILEPIFSAQPDHPGLAHYIIHAFDAPSIAEHGLDAARRYARIAPAAPHALHMPSHIFTRLGLWDESIETNRRSAAAEPDSNAAVHPLDYMVYAFLQQGRDSAAGDVVTRAVGDHADPFYGGTIGYNLVAIPARYALERSRWAEAAALPVPDGALPYVEAVTRFARAVGAARAGDAEAASADVARLVELVATLRESGDADWATRVEAQRLAAGAWAAHADGDDALALDLARQAADLEDSVEKHPVTPAPLLPARELYADLLLALDRPADALAAYQATLESEPRRARSLHGAALAAARAGREADARAYARDLLELMANADAARPEPAWALGLLRAGMN